MPDNGGYLDQDYFLINRMARLDNVYRVCERVKNAKGDEIHRLTDAERLAIRWLMDNGLWNG